MKLMKKVISIAIASLLSCSVLAASAQEREVLFEDNFDGSKKSSWTEFWGDWNFGGADNGLSVTTTAGKTLPKIITGLNQDWQHYEIEVDLEGVSNGGVIFRSNSRWKAPTASMATMWATTANTRFSVSTKTAGKPSIRAAPWREPPGN